MSFNNILTNNNLYISIHSNIKTDFNPIVRFPQISHNAYVDPLPIVIGLSNRKIGTGTSTAVCNVDKNSPVHIGNYSNFQEVILYGFEITANGINIDV